VSASVPFGMSTTAVISTTTVISTAAMVAAISAVLIAARVSATNIAMPTIRIARPISIPAAVVAISRTPIKSVAIIAAAIPRASSDKYAAYEIVRSIVAVRCACIRRIAVIPIRANRRRSNRHANGSYSHAHANLRPGAACTGKNQQSQQRHIL
jgi:hypothetical protein